MEAAHQWGAAAAAQDRHEATVRLITLLLHLRVPLVAHVRGNAEDCQCHEGACNTSTNDGTGVVMWVGHVHTSLLANRLACSWDFPAAHITCDITCCTCWILAGTKGDVRSTKCEEAEEDCAIRHSFYG